MNAGPSSMDERGEWGWKARSVTIVLVFAVFAIHAAWPIPDVNEPHYLGKAKHFWSRDWAEGDFFLDSADAHQVFYYSLGWLTRFLSLHATAVAGRVISWLFLAATWTRLARATRLSPAMAVLSAALFVGLNERCHMAGEWVVGGFEAKGIAYAFVFWAIAAAVEAKWNLAFVLGGTASAFHVLVGGWTTLTMGFAWLFDRERTAFRSILPGLVLGGCVAAVGVWPAARLGANVSPEVAQEANRIYVFERLPHHLTPQAFTVPFLERFALLCLFFFGLCLRAATSEGESRFRGVVFGSLVIAAMGIVISLARDAWPERVAGLLRFYWFRMADAFVPMGVAILLPLRVSNAWTARPLAARFALVCMVAVAAWHLGANGVAWSRDDTPRADKPGRVLDYDDWLDACDWAAEHTPRGSVFLTPRSCQTFKWRTGRGEVVTLKDIPQDAQGIVAWWRRLEMLYAHEDETMWWRSSLTSRGTPEVERLARRFGADHVLTEATPPLALERVHANASYAIYRINPAAVDGDTPEGPARVSSDAAPADVEPRP